MKQKVLLAVAVATLSACSTEEVPVENQMPVVAIETPTSVEEGAETVIPIKLSDDQTSVAALKVALSEPFRGSVVFDAATSSLIYSAGWLSGSTDKSVADSFDVTVTDADGGNTTKTVELTVTDIDSPVAISYGDLITETQGGVARVVKRYDNMSLDIWVSESQGKVTIPLNVQETDADEVSFEYAGGNFITQEDIDLRSEGESVFIDIAVGAIDLPSLSDAIQIGVADNDRTLVSNINVFVVNNISASWELGSGTISETNGGSLTWVSPQPFNYPLDYRVEITNPDGSEASFDIPNYDLDEVSRTITFEPFEVSSSIPAEITLHITDGVTEFSISKPVTFADDLDQDYESLLGRYYNDLRYYEDRKVRGDEALIADIIGKYVLIEEFGLPQQVVTMTEAVRAQSTLELGGVETSIQAIADAIAGGESNGDILAKIGTFNTAVSRLGTKAREALSEHLELMLNDSGKASDYALGKLHIGGDMKVIDDYTFSGYVGNQSYGYFVDEDQTEWGFFAEYQYLSVVNVFTSQCL